MRVGRTERRGRRSKRRSVPGRVHGSPVSGPSRTCFTASKRPSTNGLPLRCGSAHSYSPRCLRTAWKHDHIIGAQVTGGRSCLSTRSLVRRLPSSRWRCRSQIIACCKEALGICETGALGCVFCENAEPYEKPNQRDYTDRQVSRVQRIEVQVRRSPSNNM